MVVGDVIHRQERSIYVRPRFGDGSFFFFFFEGCDGAALL